MELNSTLCGSIPENFRKMHRALRFHWDPNPKTNPPDSAQFIKTCHEAEGAGIESIQLPVDISPSEALTLASEVGTRTSRIFLRIQCGLDQSFGPKLDEELKNVWNLLGGRLIFHLQPDASSLHSVREFIVNVRRLVEALRFDVEGHAAESAFAAIRHADCLWRLPDRPNQVYADALPVLHFNKEVGLVASLIARRTREEAMDAASVLLAQDVPEPKRWIGEYLWLGTMAGGSANIGVLAGSFDEVARAIVGFRSKGISQMLIRSWPGLSEISDFGANVLPRVRAIEAGG
jgi:hypothetical protein